MSLKIQREAPGAADVVRLLRQSEEHSHALYPPQSVHHLPASELAKPNVHFLVIREAGLAVACGAIVLGAGGDAELKWMFVDPTARRRGLAAALLAELEAIAARHGRARILLETGIYQQEAVALYRKAGFMERGPFGAYRADPLSIFMEKTVAGFQQAEART